MTSCQRAKFFPFLDRVSLRTDRTRATPTIRHFEAAKFKTTRPRHVDIAAARVSIPDRPNTNQAHEEEVAFRRINNAKSKREIARQDHAGRRVLKLLVAVRRESKRPHIETRR